MSFVNIFKGKYVLILNVHVCSFTCIISYVHGHAPKLVLHERNLVYRKFKFMKTRASWTVSDFSEFLSKILFVLSFRKSLVPDF